MVLHAFVSRSIAGTEMYVDQSSLSVGASLRGLETVQPSHAALGRYGCRKSKKK